MQLEVKQGPTWSPEIINEIFIDSTCPSLYKIKLYDAKWRVNFDKKASDVENIDCSSKKYFEL